MAMEQQRKVQRPGVRIDITIGPETKLPPEVKDALDWLAYE